MSAGKQGLSSVSLQSYSAELLTPGNLLSVLSRFVTRRHRVFILFVVIISVLSSIAYTTLNSTALWHGYDPFTASYSKASPAVASVDTSWVWQTIDRYSSVFPPRSSSTYDLIFLLTSSSSSSTNVLTPSAVSLLVDMQLLLSTSMQDSCIRLYSNYSSSPNSLPLSPPTNSNPCSMLSSISALSSSVVVEFSQLHKLSLNTSLTAEQLYNITATGAALLQANVASFLLVAAGLSLFPASATTLFLVVSLDLESSYLRTFLDDVDNRVASLLATSYASSNIRVRSANFVDDILFNGGGTPRPVYLAYIVPFLFLFHLIVFMDIHAFLQLIPRRNKEVESSINKGNDRPSLSSTDASATVDATSSLSSEFWSARFVVFRDVSVITMCFVGVGFVMFCFFPISSYLASFPELASVGTINSMIMALSIVHSFLLHHYQMVVKDIFRQPALFLRKMRRAPSGKSAGDELEGEEEEQEFVADVFRRILQNTTRPLNTQSVFLSLSALGMVLTISSDLQFEFFLHIVIILSIITTFLLPFLLSIMATHLYVFYLPLRRSHFSPHHARQRQQSQVMHLLQRSSLPTTSSTVMLTDTSTSTSTSTSLAPLRANEAASSATSTSASSSSPQTSSVSSSQKATLPPSSSDMSDVNAAVDHDLSIPHESSCGWLMRQVARVLTSSFVAVGVALLIGVFLLVFGAIGYNGIHPSSTYIAASDGLDLSRPGASVILEFESKFPFATLPTRSIVLDVPGLNYTDVSTQILLEALPAAVVKYPHISSALSSFWFTSFLTYIRSAHSNETIDFTGAVSASGYAPPSRFYPWLQEYLATSAALAFTHAILVYPNQTIRACTMSVLYDQVFPAPQSYDLTRPLTAYLNSLPAYQNWNLYAYYSLIASDDVVIHADSWSRIMLTKCFMFFVIVVQAFVRPCPSPKWLFNGGFAVAVIAQSFASTLMVRTIANLLGTSALPGLVDYTRNGKEGFLITPMLMMINMFLFLDPEYPVPASSTSPASFISFYRRRVLVGLVDVGTPLCGFVSSMIVVALCWLWLYAPLLYGVVSPSIALTASCLISLHTFIVTPAIFIVLNRICLRFFPTDTPQPDLVKTVPTMDLSSPAPSSFSAAVTGPYTMLSPNTINASTVAASSGPRGTKEEDRLVVNDREPEPSASNVVFHTRNFTNFEVEMTSNRE